MTSTQRDVLRPRWLGLRLANDGQPAASQTTLSCPGRVVLDFTVGPLTRELGYFRWNGRFAPEGAI